MIKRKEFPSQHKIGVRAARWLRGEIMNGNNNEPHLKSNKAYQYNLHTTAAFLSALLNIGHGYMFLE
ncbi:helix-turn-helix transcriptional regulator [Providencia alcalifaciens]